MALTLSEYAEKIHAKYHTAYEHFKKGYVQGIQLQSGRILITDDINELNELKAINKIQ